MACRVTPGEVRLVAAYLAAGGTKGAADALGIAPDTLRHRLGRAYARHEVGGIAQLVWIARRELEAVVDGPVRPVDGPGREDG